VRGRTVCYGVKCTTASSMHFIIYASNYFVDRDYFNFVHGFYCSETER
jgi:hypothetical protein